MAISPRIIRRRIKSVTSTRKITKAMELVAASKMRKAVSSVLSSRPYAEAAWAAVGEIARVSGGDAPMHPLLTARPNVKRILLIVFTSDRGLCGGFNAQITKEVVTFVRRVAEGEGAPELDVVAVGKKGQATLARMKRKIVAAFAGLTNAPRFEDVRTIADLAIRDFTAGTYDAVYVAFTDYRSALVQKPIIRQLLPIVQLGELGEVHAAAVAGKASTPTDYKFEPSPREVLDQMLPRLVEAQVWQALLESAASEHSARMMAMRTASDSASDMIDDLTLTFNQARQAGITREIAEISSGKAALE